MPVSVSYTAAAGLTQTYVENASDVEFSISDVAVLPEVEALGALTDTGVAAGEAATNVASEEIAAHGVSTVTSCGDNAVTIKIAAPAGVGQEKTIIYTHAVNNTTINDHGDAEIDELDQNGVLHLLWNGASWTIIANTAAA